MRMVKVVLLLLLLVLSCAHAAVLLQDNQAARATDDVEVSNVWVTWLQQQSKRYETAEEHERRFAIFRENLAFIRQENAKGHSYTLDIGPYTDMTYEEFAATMLMDPANGPTRQTYDEMPVLDVDSIKPLQGVDWTGHLPPIKNQGNCGSCWAFSAIAAFEGAFAIQHGGVRAFSEQQLVDCDHSSHGCNGGTPYTALQYLAGGADVAAAYPYQGVQLGCRFNPSQVGGRVTGLYSVPRSDGGMTSAVSSRPVSVCVWVSASFQHYSGGIYTGPDCPTNGATNHCVAVVGFDNSSYLVRNSWGAGWGDRGYMHVARANVCSILDWGCYVNT